MIRPSLTILRPDGTPVGGVVPAALSFSHGSHGCDSLVADIPMTQNDALRLVSSPETLDAIVAAGGAAIWRGRAEQISQIDAGVRIAAYGYWRALSDAPYTALWSDAGVANYKPITPDMLVVRTPDQWTIDTNNRLYIAPKKGNTYRPGGDIGALIYKHLNGGSRKVVAVSFSYELKMPTGFDARCIANDYIDVSAAVAWSLASNGASQTGTVNATFSAKDTVYFDIHNTSAGNITYNNEEGDYYFKVTNVRIKTTTGTVSTSAIATDLLSSINGINAGQLSTSTALITSNDLDLTDEIYEDALPSDILTRLAELGSSAGVRWETGVDENKKFYLRPHGTLLREWQADMLVLDFSRSIGEMRNSVYAVYKDTNGNTLRGAVNTDAQSANLFGLTRRMAAEFDTTSLTQANYYRDVVLSDKKTPPPTTAMKIGLINVAPWAVRAGDYINIRNIPPMFQNYGNITRFRIARTEYDAVQDTLAIETESPTPQLDVVIARAAAGIRV